RRSRRRSCWRRSPSARARSRRALEKLQWRQRADSALTAFATPFVNELRGSRMRRARTQPLAGFGPAKAGHHVLALDACRRVRLHAGLSEELVAEAVAPRCSMNSRPSFSSRADTFLALGADTAQEIGEPRVGADGIEDRLGPELDQIRISLRTRALEPFEGAAGVAGGREHSREVVGRHVPIGRLLAKMVDTGLHLAPQSGCAVPLRKPGERFGAAGR